ncbi:Nucleoid occlusion protein [subsurface metagenome]
MAEIVEIPVEKIDVGDNALRMEFDDEEVSDLAASIRRIGIIVPLVVAAAGDSFSLVAGHRRLKAAANVGLSTVPCVVRKDSESGRREVSFAENLFRADLTPIEVAAGIKDVLENQTMTVDELAVAVHHSKHWVTSMIDMLSWPDDVLQSIHEGWLSVSAGSNLALINDDTYRAFLLRNAQENGASARTTAAWLQAWRSMEPVEVAVTAEPGPAAQASVPAIPQAPCLCCMQVFRTDELAHVAICVGCINAIRGVGARS